MFVSLCSSAAPVSLDSDKLAAEFLMTFGNHALAIDQPLIFSYDSKIYTCRVKEVEGRCWSLFDDVVVCLFVLVSVYWCQSLFIDVGLCLLVWGSVYWCLVLAIGVLGSYLLRSPVPLATGCLAPIGRLLADHVPATINQVDLEIVMLWSSGLFCPPFPVS